MDQHSFIHYYKKGGSFEVYFTVHQATSAEIQTIMDYWEGKR